MAGSTIPYPLNGAANWEAFPDIVQKIQMGFLRVNLTNFNNDDLPAIASGSALDVNGTPVVFSGDEAITGWSGIAVGDEVFIKIVVTGSVATAEFTDVVPTFSAAKFGFYDGNDRYIGGLYKGGASIYSDKWLYSQSIIGSNYGNQLLRKGDAAKTRLYLSAAELRSVAVMAMRNVTEQTGITNYYLRDVIWVKEHDLFINCGSASAQDIAYSRDGLGWSNGTGSPTDSTWFGLAYSPSLDLFITVGRHAGSTGGWMSSSDGITWAATAVSDMDFKGVCWSEELTLFVAIADGGGAANRLMRSSDGSGWTEYGGTTVIGSRVRWFPGPGLFIVAGGDATGGCIWTSPDAITWTRRAMPGSVPTTLIVSDVTYSPELKIFVAVGSNNTETNNTIWYSYDTVTWYACDIELVSGYAYFSAVAYSPEWQVFFTNAMYTANRYSYWSWDGINWQRSPVQRANSSWRGICWSPELGRFVAVASSEHVFATL